MQFKKWDILKLFAPKTVSYCSLCPALPITTYTLLNSYFPTSFYLLLIPLTSAPTFSHLSSRVFPQIFFSFSLKITCYSIVITVHCTVWLLDLAVLVLDGTWTQVLYGPSCSPWTGTAQIVLGSTGQSLIAQGCIAAYNSDREYAGWLRSFCLKPSHNSYLPSNWDYIT